MQHKPVGIQDVRQWLHRGARVALYIRHAERPPIHPDDTTFGASLALTEAGERQALALGAELRGTVGGMRLVASPMARTRRTARLFADGAGITRQAVEDAEAIGVNNVFTDARGAHAVMARIGVMNYMLDYLAAGEAPHARPVSEATRLAVAWIREKAVSGLSLFCGHDLTIAAALTGLNLARFTAETWIPFLTGMAMVEEDGAWRNYWFV